MAGLKPPLGGACLVSWRPCVSQQLAHTTWGEGWHSMGQPSPQAGGPAMCARVEGQTGSSPCAHPCAPLFLLWRQESSLHSEPGPAQLPAPAGKAGACDQRLGGSADLPRRLHKALSPQHRCSFENGKSN